MQKYYSQNLKTMKNVNYVRLLHVSNDFDFANNEFKHLNSNNVNVSFICIIIALRSVKTDQ